MKKRVVMCFAAVLCAAMVFTSAPAFAESDNNVGIEMKLSGTDFTAGDVVGVDILLTDVSDEAAEGLKIGEFETHVKFDTGKLSFEKASSAFAVALDAKATKVLDVADNYNDIIVVAFDDNAGYTMSSAALTDGKLKIATLSFKVKAGVKDGDTAAFVLEEGFDKYVTVVSRPVEATPSKKEYNCKVDTAEKIINFHSYIIDIGTPAYSSGGKNITATVGVTAGTPLTSETFIIALYDSNGLLLACRLEKAADYSQPKEVSFGGITAPGEYVVMGYMWNDINGMQALSMPVRKTVTVQ